MAIEIRTRGRHRCTDCGEKWWSESYPDDQKWVACADPIGHPCPKCSKPVEPEPAKVECDAPEYHEPGAMGSWWRFCPHCGVALTTENTP